MVGRFDRGVSYYTDCKLEMMVHFPEDEVKCRWCPFLRHYDNIDRDKCGPKVVPLEEEHSHEKGPFFGWCL